jgi:peptide/nickel transport system substrate-binding protein
MRIPRYLVVAAVLATMAFGVWAGPTAETGQPAASASGKPVRGGMLSYADQNDCQTFDPHRSTGGSMAYTLVYDTLVRWSVQPDGKIAAEPRLATEWKLEGSTATFKLRQGVKFHDGSDWNAEVAKFNLERMNDGKSQARAFVSGIKSIDIIDPYTIRLNLTGPQGSLLSNLSDAADGRPYIISKAMAEKAGDKYGTTPELTAGTGPMKLIEFVGGSHHVAERTGNYWQKGADGQALPYFDKIRVRFIKDDSVRFAELRSGNVDMINNMASNDVKTGQQDAKLVINRNPYQMNCYQFTFSFKSDKFQDLKLRQAFHYAMDREAMAKVLGEGLGEVHSHFLLPGYLGYDKSLPSYSYNLEKAKQLVKEAGYPNGVDISLIVINREADLRQAQMLKQMLADAGIRITIETLERLAWLAKVQTLKFEFATYYTGVRPDPDSILAGRFQTGEGKNQSGMSDPVMDALLAKGRDSMDDAVRQAAYADVQKRIYETAWYGTMWMKGNFSGIQKRVQGLIETQGGWDLSRTWLTQ